ncbi:heterokaryon incompatibility protein-domain-containing protein [Xylaria acuta]|nr:heterokaryon incompatibility protein-domain-containing protein [Xylaria acuta]
MEDTVDPRLLRTWLQISASATSQPSPPPVRTWFINSETSTVIGWTTDQNFAVLSYVWGDAKQLCLDKRTKPVLTAPGGLEAFQADLPRAISDAIALCKVVGERLLWIDALCIQQDDPQDKQSQIAAIGSIYGSASFTIVQASSNPATDANHPLPGLLPGSRTIRQRSEIIQGTYTTNAPPASFWRSTEVKMAYASVFLTSDGNHIFCEDTVFEHNQPSKMLGRRTTVPSLHVYDWDFNPFDKAVFSSDAERLFFLITDYIARQVRQEDSLSAITALLTRFELKLGEAK